MRSTSSIITVIGTVAGSVAAIALCGLGAASAAPVPAQSSLVITVYDNQDPNWPVLHEVTLKCEPTGGTHPHADDACATVDSVDGNFEAIEPLAIACPLYYQPVVVEVGGNWRDKVVNFEEEYANKCVAAAESAGVFRFDEDAMHP